MRVLMLANTFPPQRYGISNHVAQLATNLAELGHDIQLVVPTPGLPSAHFPKRMRVLKYRTIMGNSTGFGLTMFLKSLEVITGSDIIHCHMLSPAGLVGSWLKKISSTSYIITIHGWSQLSAVPKSIKDHYSGPYFSLLRAGLKPSLMNADRVIAVSSFIRNLIVQSGVEPRKVDILGSGIDPDEFRGIDYESARKRIGIDNNTKVVLYVARLAVEKGHELLLDAIPIVLKSFPNTKFVFCGDGPLREYLHKKVSRLDISRNVTFTGFVNTAVKNMYYVGCDLFTYPALADPFSLAPLEAMTAGKPVIAFRAGGCVDIVKDGITGRLTKPFDVSDFADAICSYLGNPELSMRHGKNARKVVVEERSWRTIAERTLHIYEKCI